MSYSGGLKRQLVEAYRSLSLRGLFLGLCPKDDLVTRLPAHLPREEMRRLPIKAEHVAPTLWPVPRGRTYVVGDNGLCKCNLVCGGLRTRIIPTCVTHPVMSISRQLLEPSALGNRSHWLQGKRREELDFEVLISGTLETTSQERNIIQAANAHSTGG